MTRQDIIARSLADCVARLDVVLQPLGFHFEQDGFHLSHTGPYASGYYVRDTTRIGLSCRDTIDNILYEHSFITERGSWREIVRFDMGHGGLMKVLGHATECRLIGSDGIPDAVVARDGGDRVSALIHDLTLFVTPILREPAEEFYAVMRRGRRSYAII